MRFTAVRLLASTALIGAAAPALAQTPQDQRAPAAEAIQPSARQNTGDSGDQNADVGKTPTSGLDDIVVTANRVESSAQRTPVALTVYSGGSLAAAGVKSVAELQKIDPSVNFTARNGGGYIGIRGIASTDVTEIGDPSVPIARDGFFSNRSFSIATSMYDLQRVEVLKGPQGTLFGRNSTGGLISLVTRRPGKELGGNFALEAGNYGTVNAEAGVDIPVGDRLQLRFSGIARRHDGYRYLTGVNIRGDDDQTVSGRVTIAFQPFDGFDGIIQYQHDDINDVGDVSASGTIARPLPASFDPKRFPNSAPTYNRVNGNRVRWEFTYDRLPLDMALTYAGGYDSQQWHHALDSTGAGPRSNFIQEEKPDTWNHEVRLATPQDRTVSAQVGYFHFGEQNTLFSGQRLLSGPFANQYQILFNYGVKTSSDAVFGQFGVRPTETVRLTGGVRYTWDKKDRVGTSQLRCDIAGVPPFLYGVLGCVGNPPILPGVGNGSIRQSKPTFLLGADWSVTPTNFLYAKYSTGYKSGGFNSNGSAPSVNYGPENVTAWELGTKNKFADNNIQLNADIFYQTYKGYQASQATPAISSGSGVFNIGSATIYGAEAQFIALFGAGRFDLNGTYLHAQFDKNIGTVTTTDPATGASTSVDISGNRLPNAPRLSLAAGLEYKIALGGGGTLTPRIDGKYSSAFYFDVFNTRDTSQAAYATGNASITWVPAGGRLSLAAFVRNFTDEAVYANAQRVFVSQPGANAYQFQPPRTYGLRLTFDY